MRIARSIAAVIVGYAIFAVSAVVLFKVAGIDPHADTGFGTEIGIIVFGCVFAFVGGYVAKLIAATNRSSANIVLALLMATFATFSAVKSPGEHYTKIAAIFLFAPASLIGSIARRSKKLTT